MALKLFHCHEARSMRSLWLINELKLDVDVVLFSFGRALRSDDYLSRHPLGRVPCLEDGELTLFESGAIAEYLCEIYDDGVLWRAPGHKERPEWLQWIHYAETMTVHAANLTQQAIVISDPALRSPTVQKLETRRLGKAIEVLESQLQDRDYLLASGFSAADVGVGYSLHVGRLFTDIEAYPNVAAYYQRLSSREAFKQSLPAMDAEHKIYTQQNYWLTE
ncbi:glutathione S-transferase family protein [Neptunomonas japonica]|uniref:Glutathione S-transferase n=1 Tax=Neptunomonas japonica JAMM 1380 TaxID=1441457 RepID=A0A7R6PHS8_9GAMM|nr:glutathione S-transferase family protein [Neptunomonas japonica]BBB30457.1 glutathione S-transferase [Neptunomonas japonica JAMM 1380]